MGGGILLNSLFVYLKAFSGGIQMLVSIFSMEMRRVRMGEIGLPISKML